jgi:hypothetical protein
MSSSRRPGPLMDDPFSGAPYRGQAQSDLPFRWLVTIDDRQRPAISIVAVLRQVREALDPGYRTGRVRVTAFPLVPT